MQFRKWLAVIAFCVLVTAGLAFVKYRQIQAAIASGAAYPEQSEYVEPFIARQVSWQPGTTVHGEVVAIRSVELQTELAGRIVEVGFAPGARVRKGQLLVQLDTSEEHAQLAAARADVELTRVELDRAERVLGPGAGTVENRDQARARHDAALAEIERLQAIIDKKTLRAPFDARAGLHTLEAGQFLDRGAVITRLVGSTGQVWVDFSLPQSRQDIAIGTGVQIRSGAVDSVRRTASIISRDAAVNASSRMVRFRALAANEDAVLLPGMAVNVRVPLGAAVDMVEVPAAAVRRDILGTCVYVLVPAEAGAAAPERARRRVVTVGPQQDGRIIIQSGLKPGERIAANGAFKLRDGMLVHAAPPARDQDGE